MGLNSMQPEGKRTCRVDGKTLTLPTGNGANNEHREIFLGGDNNCVWSGGGARTQEEWCERHNRLVLSHQHRMQRHNQIVTISVTSTTI